MRVSVVVPVRNGEAHLHECLESLVRQTLVNFEIIVIDDSSTDGTGAILSDFEQRHPGKFVVLRPDIQCGPGGARNIGLEVARGEYIAFVDADDWLDPSMLEKLYQRGVDTNADVVACDFYSFEGPGLPLKVKSSWDTDLIGEASREMSERRVALGSWVLWGAIIRRSMFSSAGLHFAQRTTSSDMLCRYIWCLAGVIEKVQEPLYTYRNDNPSIARSRNNWQHLRKSREVLSGVVDKFVQDDLFEEHREGIEAFAVHASYVAPIFDLLFKFDSPPVAELRAMRDEVRKAYPDYRRNRYFARLPRKMRALSLANDLSPLALCALAKGMQVAFGRWLPAYLGVRAQ